MDPTELDADHAPRLHLRDLTEPVPQDFGGRPLEGLLGAPMEPETFLRLAIGIASALDEVHQRGLVHRDVKPANILVNPASGEVRITGFGLATRLASERQRPEPPESIAGTLAYMAPEQTGRMNRPVDSRSDLCSLGVTLYQMLTGTELWRPGATHLGKRSDRMRDSSWIWCPKCSSSPERLSRFPSCLHKTRNAGFSSC